MQSPFFAGPLTSGPTGVAFSTELVLDVGGALVEVVPAIVLDVEVVEEVVVELVEVVVLVEVLEVVAVVVVVSCGRVVGLVVIARSDGAAGRGRVRELRFDVRRGPCRTRMGPTGQIAGGRGGTCRTECGGDDCGRYLARQFLGTHHYSSR